MESREKSATPVATPLGTRASSSAQSRHCDQSMSVDPQQVASRGTNPRFGAVQCGHRQQVARLRCRRPQGRGRCSKWICVWIFSGSSAGGSHIRVDRLPGLLRQFETDGLPCLLLLPSLLLTHSCAFKQRSIGSATQALSRPGTRSSAASPPAARAPQAAREQRHRAA